MHVWQHNPLLEGDDPVPFVSSTAHSKLVIRAVLRDDQELLKACIADKKQVQFNIIVFGCWNKALN